MLNVSSRSIIPVLGKCAIVSCLAVIISNVCFAPSDQQLLLRLLAIHELINRVGPADQTANFFTVFLVQMPLILIIYQAALRTKGLAKCVTTAQVLVLSYFCNWLVWTTFSMPTSPISLLLGLAGGFFWGEADQHAVSNKQANASSELVLSLKENELKEAHLQLVKQDEADRRLLASDLHDQVLNDLKSLRLGVEALKQMPDLEARAAKIKEIEALLDQTTDQVRDVMENLTPSVLENLGLASALEDLLRRSGSRGKLKFRFKNESGASLSKLSKIEELLLFRTVQESLSNILKHAQAQRVELSLAEQAGELVISINDDGLGIPADKHRGQSRGLRYMRQRADLMGAHIAWLPGRDNKGCLVEIKIRLKEA